VLHTRDNIEGGVEGKVQSRGKLTIFKFSYGFGVEAWLVRLVDTERQDWTLGHSVSFLVLCEDGVSNDHDDREAANRTDDDDPERDRHKLDTKKAHIG